METPLGFLPPKSRPFPEKLLQKEILIGGETVKKRFAGLLHQKTAP